MNAPRRSLFRQRPQFLPALLLIVTTVICSGLYIHKTYGMNSRLAWHDKSEFILHILIASGIVVLLLFVFSLCVTVITDRRLSAIRLMIRMLLSSYFLFLALFYPVSLLANYLWGDHVTFQLIREYITEIPLLIQVLPIKPLYISVCLPLVIGIYVAFYWGLQRVHRYVLATLEACLLLQNIRFGSILTIGGFLLIGYGFSIWSLFHAAPPFKFWKEPFMDFYLATNYVAADINPWRLYVAEQDRLSRNRYVALKDIHKRPNIILIIVDSLRADHLPIYGYSRETSPFMSRLNREGLIKKVDQGLATCPNTYCGVLSILNSKPLRDISYDNFKLHDLLRLVGYKINFILSGDHISWYNLGTAYGQHIDVFFDFRQTKSLSNSDDHIIEEGLNTVPQFNGTPNFFFFHLMSAHALGLKKEGYKTFLPTTVEEGSSHQVKINRYDNGVVQADGYIEKIMTRLKDLGYLSDSFVVITSDHGEGLGEDGRLPDHGWNLQQHQIRIPILFYDTGKRAFGDLTLGRQVDIAPTIIDRIGLPRPEVWWGSSLFSKTRQKCSYHQSVKGDPSFGIVCQVGSSIYKYVLQRSKLSLNKSEVLYDLTSDPQEKMNLAPNNPALLDRFRKLFRSHWESRDIH